MSPGLNVNYILYRICETYQTHWNSKKVEIYVEVFGKSDYS